MRREQYIHLRNNPEADVMPVYFFFYDLKLGKPLSYQHFVHAFSVWIYTMLPAGAMMRIQYNVFRELDHHFKII